MAFLEKLQGYFSSAPGETRLIIVGLGNPGAEYEATRHNAGFVAIDALAHLYQAKDWQLRFESMVAEKPIRASEEDIKLILAKPQTMMNRSGRAIKKLLSHYQLDLDGLIVIHDDIALPPDTLRVKYGGGHGGHNGLRDIIAAVGADFYRIKIGVGAPPGRMDSAQYVLQTLSDDAFEEMRVQAARAALAAESLIEQGLEATQNQFN